MIRLYAYTAVITERAVTADYHQKLLIGIVTTEHSRDGAEDIARRRVGAALNQQYSLLALAILDATDDAYAWAQATFHFTDGALFPRTATETQNQQGRPDLLTALDISVSSLKGQTNAMNTRLDALEQNMRIRIGRELDLEAARREHALSIARMQNKLDGLEGRFNRDSQDVQQLMLHVQQLMLRVAALEPEKDDNGQDV